MANVTINSGTIGSIQPNAPTGLTATTAFDGVQLDWVNPTNTPIEYIQIASSTTNNVAAGFSTVANVKSTAFYDHSTIAGNVYYCVRAVSTLGNIGPWNAADTAGTLGTPQEVTITSAATGDLLTYDGTKWVNSKEVSQNISGNAAPTFTRATTSTTIRTALRIRKSLTTGSRTDGDGPNLVWSYTDGTGGYDYGGMRFRYYGSGDHDLVIFTSTDTSNAFGGATTLATINSTVSTFAGAPQSTNNSNAIGYATGAGATVTQLTSKSTGVTIDTPTGAITCNAAALASATNVSFTVTNSTVQATDSVIVNLVSGTANNTSYWVWAGLISAGSFQIGIRNITGGSLSEAIVLRYSIIRGVSA